MRGFHPQRVPSGETALQATQIEEFLHTLRGLEAYSEPNQLLHFLPSVLSDLVDSDATALVLIDDGAFSCNVVSRDGSVIAESEPETWRAEIYQIVSGQPQPIVVSLLHETEFHSIAQTFREQGTSLSVYFLSIRRSTASGFSALLGEALTLSRRAKLTF
jgi:hypothetical protein